MSRDSLVGLYNNARILVLPSLFDPDPLVVKEAMACGTPVVLSDGVGSSEIVSKIGAGLVFPSGDVKALVSCIRTLLLDEELALETGNNGREYAEKRLSWLVVSSRYIVLFREVLSNLLQS